DRCTACNLCVKACPNKLITLEGEGTKTFVLCNNLEKGAVVRKKCSKGCIACTKCVRECPAGAITMADNLARIDPEKCTNCGVCAEVCITKCIKTRA
ncbi:MAG: 4Fe-4S binding protein, partial [Oscillospiraceae bacterium]|nr:4Fe-4S binding protein [Oscillospiraceae bacterium]